MILVERQDERARRDVFAYLAITHLGGIGVWASMLVLAGHGAFSGAALHSGGLRALVAVMAIVGFGIWIVVAPSSVPGLTPPM